MTAPSFDQTHKPGSGSAGTSPVFEGERGALHVTDRFVVVRLRFRANQDLALNSLTHSHPEIVVSMTAIQSLPPDRFIVEFEVNSSAPKDLTDEVAQHPAVVSVTRLTPIGPRSRYQMVTKLPADYLILAGRLGTLLRYPRTVRDGVHTVEVAATTSQLRQLIEELGTITHGVEVLRFGRAQMSTCPTSLTPQEYSLLHQALADGYFDVPRRITLTAFAKKLGRSKSGVSERLALIEEKLVVASVSTPG